MNILVVCLGNAHRSPMAEVLLRRELQRLGRPDIQVSSAGLSPWSGALPAEAVGAMRERGLDISGHIPRGLAAAGEADIVLVMEESMKKRVAEQIGGGEGRVWTWLEFAGNGKERDVADPWVTKDHEGCARLLTETAPAVARRLVEWDEGRKL